MESVESRAKEALEAYLKCNETVKSVYYKKICDHDCDNCNLNYAQGTYGDHKEAVKTAIQALEEVQQYRAIGTPEELQDMKRNYFEALSDWRQYRKIGTLEECRTAVEKQTARKGIREKIKEGYNRGMHHYYCPVCYEKGDLRNKFNVGLYCSDCGQKLDWSDENADSES